jgi:hypothetical protein
MARSMLRSGQLAAIAVVVLERRWGQLGPHQPRGERVAASASRRTGVSLFIRLTAKARLRRTARR